MALGLASGRESLKDPAYPDPKVLDEATGNPQSLETIRNFYKDWVKTFGSYRCEDVQKHLMGESWDLGKPAEFAKFKQKSEHVCPETVAKTARMVAEVILNMPRR
jgi:hypothetical protein